MVKVQRFVECPCCRELIALEDNQMLEKALEERTKDILQWIEKRYNSFYSIETSTLKKDFKVAWGFLQMQAQKLCDDWIHRLFFSFLISILSGVFCLLLKYGSTASLIVTMVNFWGFQIYLKLNETRRKNGKSR